MGCSGRTIVPGVELVVDRTKQFKTGLLTVTLTVPLRAETATAYALIPEVLYRGSKNHPDIESLSAATDRLYGAALGPAVRQRGECQCISFLCSFIDDRFALDGTAVLESVADLMGEVLLDPITEDGIFRRDFVSMEGANLADRIRSRVNDKQVWAVFRMIQEMCSGEAYALDKLGVAEEAEKMDAARLWECYQQLLREAHITFYYSGTAELLQVETAVRHSFGKLLVPRAAGYSCWVRSDQAGGVKELSEPMEVAQGKLAMGFRTGGITLADEGYPALLVLHALFGGTAHSKLFMHVREEMSLCYHVSSQLDVLKGIMVVSAGMDIADIELGKQAILFQLDQIRSGVISQTERNAAVRAVVSELAGKRDSQGQMEDSVVTELLVLGGRRDDAELIRAVESVTVEKIVSVAHRVCLDTVFVLTGKEAE